jgi:hypothetical protein
MKKVILGLTLAVASIGSLADWVPSYRSGYFTGTASYNGKAVATREIMTSPGVTVGPMASFAKQVYALPQPLKKALDAAVTTVATSNGGSFLQSELSGPLNASISGLTGALTGWNRITFSGPSYWAVATVSGSQYGIGYTCQATLRANDITFSAVYDPYMGTINTSAGASYVDVHPSGTASCTSSISWIPIIGWLIDDFISDKAEDLIAAEMNGISAQALSTAVPYGPKYLGIYAAVPLNTYFIDGIDIGLYLRNNFSSLFTGRTLSLSLGPFVPGPIVYGGAGGGPLTVNGNVIRIDFSDQNTQLSFSIEDSRTYRYSWVCSVANPSLKCAIP